MVIHKAILHLPRGEVTVPGYPLSVGFQSNDLCVWYRVAPVEWSVRVVMTGEDTPLLEERTERDEFTGAQPPRAWHYLNTLQTSDQTFVLHAFQKFVRSTGLQEGGL